MLIQNSLQNDFRIDVNQWIINILFIRITITYSWNFFFFFFNLKSHVDRLLMIQFFTLLH